MFQFQLQVYATTNLKIEPMIVLRSQNNESLCFSFVKIPAMVSWHADSAIVMIANDKCQVQYFDISLSCVRNQILNEDMVPMMILELSTYFTNQPSLLKFCCSKKPELNQYNNKYIQNDSFLLVM